MMKRAVLLVVFCCLAALNAHGQAATAQISGTVTDASGSVVPGAHVQVTDTDTGAVRTADSKDDGTFIFPSLAIGPYKLEVSKEGFQTFVQTGIVLQINVNPAIPVVLQVGNVSQTVEVQANASMVETQSNGVGQVIQPEQVVDLPLNGRQPTQLIALSGAAVSTSTANGAGTAPNGGLTGTLDYPTAVSFSVAGSQSNATNYYLDGAANVDYRTLVGLPMPFPDALQEFKVESSALPADTGSRPGGTVSALTKSGTNELHGDVFEFLRNGVMDADAFNFPAANGTLPNPSHDNLKRNQFGGVIGGPIKRDKVFFFYGFQETMERQNQAPTTRTVPTAAMLAGNFTAFLAPPCQSSQQFLNATVGGQQLTTAPNSNIILPIWLSTPSAQIAAKVAKLFGPLPTNPCGSVTTVGYQHDNEYQHVGRVDWQHTANDTLFARFYLTNYTLLSSLQPGDILTSSGDGLADRAQTLAIGDTHIFSPQVISSFRVSFDRTATVRTSNNSIPNVCSLGMNATCPLPNVISVLFLEPGNLGWDYENSWGLSENIGWQIHSHQLQLGFAGEHVQMNGNGVFQLNPLPTFSSGSSSYTNNNIADFITGNVDGYGQGNGQLSHDGQNLISLYFQDNWKMTRTFQLNYGLRWDPYIPQHNKYDEVADFSIANYNAGVQSGVFTNAPPGMIFTGDSGVNGKSDTHEHLLDFSPRIGLVWDPRGKGEETIRAGYGIFYDTSLMWNAMHVVLDPPWGETLSFTPLPVNPSNPAASGGLANPFFGQSLSNPFPTPIVPPHNFSFPPNGTFVFQQSDLRPAYAQSWNLSFQKQLSANWLVSASYLGSKTTHIWLGQNLDPDVLITAGMTAPGIVANNVVAGNPTSGSCTLLYQGQDVTFPTCNVTATAKTANQPGVGACLAGPFPCGTTVNDESARKALNLSNPSQGYKLNGGLLEATNIGDAAYNGLLLAVQHRLSRDFAINANYTWSHCLDDGELGQDIGAVFQNPANPKADWGNCGFDHRHIGNVSLVAETPKFSNTWTERIVGSWTGSGIFTVSSGAYNNVTDGSDQSLIGLGGVPGTGGTGNDRPEQVGNPFQAGTIAANPTCVAPSEVQTQQHWFNPCAFELQPAGTFGDTARNSLLGPGRWNFDAAIWRTFPITERFKLDFRFEGFNVFNHPQFGNPATALGTASSFTRITSTITQNNQRILQAALKLNF